MALGAKWTYPQTVSMNAIHIDCPDCKSDQTMITDTQVLTGASQPMKEHGVRQGDIVLEVLCLDCQKYKVVKLDWREFKQGRTEEAQSLDAIHNS